MIKQAHLKLYRVGPRSCCLGPAIFTQAYGAGKYWPSLKLAWLSSLAPLVIYTYIESANIVSVGKVRAYLMSTNKFNENFNGQIK